jgi:hypothetical protein
VRRCSEAVRHEREISIAGRLKLDFAKRDHGQPVLLGLSLAGNLAKPLRIKGSLTRAFRPGFIHESASCGPYSISMGSFQIFRTISGDIRRYQRHRRYVSKIAGVTESMIRSRTRLNQQCPCVHDNNTLSTVTTAPAINHHRFS